MPVVRFYLNDDAYAELEASAKACNLTVQDYVRKKCLPNRENNLTVEDVVNQINSQKPEGDFKLSDLFSSEQWLNTSIGVRAYLGKAFYEKTIANEIPNVEFIGMKKRIAHYRYIRNRKG